MRKTLVIDDDLAAMLQIKVEASGLPFKQVLNDALRAGLTGLAPTIPAAPAEAPPAPNLELAPGYDPEQLNQMLDDLAPLPAALEPSTEGHKT